MATKKSAKQRSKKKIVTNKSKRPFLPWIIGLGVLLLAGIPILINYLEVRNLPGERFRSQGNVHIQEGAEHPEYNSNPPTSGWHLPGLISWGSYDYLVSDEGVIHNMEDGGVVLWYAYGTPEENEERIAALEEVASGYRRIVIAPREDMPTTYALTAWQRLQRFEEIDREGMRKFIRAYEGIDNHVGGVG